VILLGVFCIGLGIALMVWAGARGLFEQPVLQRVNYRGAKVPTAGGIVIVVAVLGTVGLLTLAFTVSVEADARALAAADTTLLAVIGFGLLGLFDDIAGVSTASGYRGHLAALFRGDLTSGAVKMLGGAVLSVVVVAAVAGDSAARLLLDGALVALAANLANLFDRAPGRVTKISLVCFALLVVTAGAAPELAGAAITMGAAAALLLPDLRERLMLGDTGANPLGGALGLAAVLAYSEGTRLVILGALALFNLASELVSFSATIERVAPLRALDLLGRRRSGDADG
jgi:UDP-N-acetylmuramyl pentapeptide phosphotransferase/UDP-N-acetylglucosamine-1-phosphate transferase